jgi:hypothetical protein
MNPKKGLKTIYINQDEFLQKKAGHTLLTTKGMKKFWKI